ASRPQSGCGRIALCAADIGSLALISVIHCQAGSGVANIVITMGRTKRSPTVADIAPAPDRRTNPKDTPIRAMTAMDTAAARIGRIESAGASHGNGISLAPKIGVTARAVANEMIIDATKRNTPTTMAFAARTEPRTGSAARVERIMPVEYSPVTAIAPRIPASSIVNWTGAT